MGWVAGADACKAGWVVVRREVRSRRIEIEIEIVGGIVEVLRCKEPRDAMAVCWTAERILNGQEIRVPAKQPWDSRGLRMEMVR